MNNTSAFQLYRTSWFSQNLSSRALNVFKVGDETMLSGKLFHNGMYECRATQHSNALLGSASLQYRMAEHVALANNIQQQPIVLHKKINDT